MRFVNVGEYSLNIDVFAYVSALDWNHFLEVQETLLFGVTEVVEAAGTGLAFRGVTLPEGVRVQRPAISFQVAACAFAVAQLTMKRIW